MSATVPRFDVSLPSNQPNLHSKQQTLASVLDPSYWQQLNPGLHVGDAAFISSSKAIKPPKSRLKDLCQQINEAGVAQVAPEELQWGVDLGTLADAVVNLVRHGWPPSMLLVYDEVWAMVQQASTVMKKATGGNMCNMDILAWLVDPNKGDTGFSPHRDRQPDDSPATFRPDGTAMYATMWVPLTNATPENSCLYVIPRFADPGYYVGDPEEEGAPDPLTAALPNKEAYQHIRALPAQPGAALLFTHRTIHWGSKGRPGYPTPRISISWGCADDAFEPPYFSRSHLPCPPLELRLALVGAQMIIYHERFPAPPKQLRLYYEAFTAQSAKFDSSYRAKVVREFVDASKEATAAAAAAAGAKADPVTAPAAAGDVRGSGKGASAANGVDQHPHSSPGGSDGQVKTSKRKRRQAAAAAAAAAAAGQQSPASAAAGATASTPPQAKATNKQQQQPGPTAHEQQQQQQVQQAQQKRQKGTPAAADVLPPPSAAAESKRSKRQKRQHANGDAVAAAVAAAGAVLSPAALAAAASDSDSEDDGVGIDWALLAAQAKAQKAKGKAKAGSSGANGVAGGKQGQEKNKKTPGKSGAAAAAATAAAAAAAAATADSDDDDDVLDMALEAMLDGDGDFVDDYED